MPLLTETTHVSAQKTFSEIHQCLAAQAAKALLSDYDDKER